MSTYFFVGTMLLRASVPFKMGSPGAYIEPPGPGTNPGSTHEPPQPPRPSRNDFRCGEKVAFEDKYLNTAVGTIVRINQRTATIDPSTGTSWRVGFGLLRHVVDL